VNLEPADGIPPSGPINRLWRVVATGISFALFGIAGLAAGATLFPLLCLTARDAAGARRRAQWLISTWFLFFANFMRFVGVISYEVHGAEKLRRPGVMIIANHPSLIDVVLLIARVRVVDCIVKRAVVDNPFMRWPANWAGYICHQTPEQLITDCTAALSRGHSLMIFPESTRTVPGEPIRMMHGAARIALEAGATVLPVTIDCRPATLTKGNPWYNVPARRPHYLITVGEPQHVPRTDAASANISAAARRLTYQWEQYFAARTGARAAHPLADAAAPPQYSLRVP
jgi:1-acyl-sn-glycerol-3-phosphate acyltransferase